MNMISTKQANSFYWLGRYTERMSAILDLYIKNYDCLLTEDGIRYVSFCKQLGIPNVYEDQKDFLMKYPFDPKNPDSLISILFHAYDHALVLKDSISEEGFSQIQLAIYDMNKAAGSKHPGENLQKANEKILCFYDMVDIKIDDEHCRNIIKAGRWIERVSLYATLGAPIEVLRREVDKMIPRVEKSSLSFDIRKFNIIRGLVREPSPDYGKIAEEVESIFSELLPEMKMPG